MKILQLQDKLEIVELLEGLGKKEPTYTGLGWARESGHL